MYFNSWPIFKNKWILSICFFLFLFFLASGIYWHTLNFYFFDDDFVWLYRAQGILLGTFSVFHRFSGFFMPMVNIYFTALYSFFGANPFWLHLTNIFIHSLNVFLLYFLTKKMFSDKKIAFIACLYFLAARYHLEAITWISAITMLLSFQVIILGGLSWFAFLRNNNKIYYYLVILLAVVSLSLKEWSVLYLPFLIVITLLGFSYNTLKKLSLKKLLIYWLPIIVIFLCYGLWQFFYFKNNSVLIAGGYYAFGPHIIKNILLNVLLLFLPLVNVAQNYQVLFAGGSIFFLFIVILLTRRLKFFRAIIVCAAWAITALVPTALFIKWSFVSRYSYLSMIGAAWIVGVLIKALLDKYHQKYHQGLIISVLALMVLVNVVFIQRVLTVSLAPVYANSRYLTDMTGLISVSPDSAANIYNCNFMQIYLLHYAARVTSWRQDFKVRQLYPEAPCPKGEVCWYWDYHSGYLKKMLGDGNNNPYYKSGK